MFFFGQRFLYIRRDNGGVTVGRAVSQMKRFLTKSSMLSPRKQPGPVSSSALVESITAGSFRLNGGIWLISCLPYPWSQDDVECIPLHQPGWQQPWWMESIAHHPGLILVALFLGLPHLSSRACTFHYVHNPIHSQHRSQVSMWDIPLQEWIVKGSLFFKCLDHDREVA